MKQIDLAVQVLGNQGRARRLALTLGVLTAVSAPAAGAQRANRAPESLRGSRPSVEKMYDFAQRYRYPFYLTPTNIDLAVAQGRLVALTGDSTYELARGVGFSYATPEARRFVTLFAPQYLAACGAPLTLTSAARPKSRQPHNANPHSVHPTGIAVDIRRPPRGPCLTWVRNALADLEGRGVVEATEEHHPVHLHIAVLRAPGSSVALPDLTHGVRVPRLATPAPAGVLAAAGANGEVAISSGAVRSGPASRSPANTGPRTYVVRQGDTLWDVAQKVGVSVKALAQANHRSTRGVLKPGTMLLLPGGNSQ